MKEPIESVKDAVITAAVTTYIAGAILVASAIAWTYAGWKDLLGSGD